MNVPFPILIAIFGFAVLLGGIYVVGMSKKWGIMLPFAGMLLFGSMSKPIEWDDRVVPTFWLPVQSARSEFFLAAGAGGLLMVLLNLKRIHGKGLSWSVWVLVAAGFYASLLRFAHDTPSQGVMSMVFSMCTLIPLAMAAPMVMEKIEDIMILFKAVILVNVAWIGMVAVQMVVNRQYVTEGKEQRFVGILSNPQHAGVLMAFFVVISLWMLLVERGRYRVFYLCLVGLNFLLLMWTGSRTGLGMALIGISAVLYSKAGRAILLLPIAGATTYISAKFLINVLGIDLGFSRLGSTADTRTYAWISLIETGMDNLAIGIGTYESSYSENSWLYGFAAYGLVMLLLLLLMTVIAMVEVLKLVRLRFQIHHDRRPIIDVLLGLFAMYFAGAMLEGFIISRVSAALCLYPLFAGASAVVLRMALTQDSEVYEYDEGSGYESGYEDGYDEDYEGAY